MFESIYYIVFNWLIITMIIITIMMFFLYIVYLFTSNKNISSTTSIEKDDSYNNNVDRVKSVDSSILLELLPIETSGLVLNAHSISTITFFNGIINIQKLMMKITDIIRYNPWLQGKLVQKNGKIYVEYNPQQGNISDISTLFTTVEIFNLNQNLSLSSIQNYTKQYTVKQGSLCLNKNNESLFKITFIYTSKNSCALIISLCHILGDGYTFYNIYKMLNDDNDVISLIPYRDFKFDIKLKEITKNNVTEDWLFSIGTMINIIMNLIIIKKKYDIIAFDFNQDWLNNEKENYLTSINPSFFVSASSSSLSSSTSSTNLTSLSLSASFISVNDIITSWFFRLCKCDVGLMLINYRQRIPTLTTSHAGNYQSCIAYQQNDYLHPSLIRSSLLEKNHYTRVITKKLPNFLQSLQLKLGGITNWSTFYTKLNFNNCQEIYHMPILSFIGEPLAHNDIAILFKSTPYQYSMITACTSFNKNNLIENHIDKIKNIKLL